MCEAYENWGFYMRDMIAAKKMDKDPDPSANRATDLLELLCQSQDRKSLSDSEVLGNLFVFIIAGHETSASSLHMTILLLALHPQFQKDIQRELEDVFQGRPPSQWTYENDFHRLCNCLMLMAAWNEEMRLVAPIMSIPKVVCSTPQQIEVDRQTIMIPANTIIRLCVPSVHTNSRYWPHNLPSDPANPVFQHDNVNNDLEEYNPRRWLENDISESAGFSNSPTSQHLFNPVKGSFVPFSAGARSCLGQKFAKVEILTALAMIFSTYSVELATDEFAEDTQVAEMSTESKREIWGKAAEKARNCWQNKMTCSFTVHMNEDVPLKFVKKGKENFFEI
jgi:cytochrome P450